MIFVSANVCFFLALLFSLTLCHSINHDQETKTIEQESAVKMKTPKQWTQFRLTSDNCGSFGKTEIAKPKLVWKFETGDVIESSAAIVGDTAYVGGHAKYLHALDLISGKLKWKFKVAGWVRASPSVVDGVVFFGADDNKFYAVDAKTGEKAWDFGLGEGGEQSSPWIEDGVVYFGAFRQICLRVEGENRRTKSGNSILGPACCPLLPYTPERFSSGHTRASFLRSTKRQARNVGR